MRLLICGPYPYKNEKIWGGVESVIYNLEHGIDQFHGIIPEILSYSSSQKSKVEKIANVKYIKIPKFKIGTVYASSFPLRIKSALKSDMKKFEIINSHAIDFAFYSLKFNNKLIFTLHGIPWEEKEYLKGLHKLSWIYFYDKRLKKILKKIKYVVSINPYARKIIESYSQAKIFEINNPVTDDYFHINNENNNC